ncbi:hypothetical protein FOL47_008719 [Perkinsus chesapeaki]|uniref:Uncharacterized protein n=1 Tax=Perkinsus chesapeaki TaxID=330153 RepID=A0A7J6LCG3_PERCH|nr:hypothetical protein FOL47_008719 [Perkinsus chesapeaki]
MALESTSVSAKALNMVENPGPRHEQGKSLGQSFDPHPETSGSRSSRSPGTQDKMPREHANSALARLFDPQKALAFHKAWQNKRRAPPATYMKATELAEVMFPEEEVDLPQQAEARGELNSRLVELRREPSLALLVGVEELLDAVSEL